MSNRYADHLHVLPEDDANRQLANGVLLRPDIDHRRMQVLPPLGGWLVALSRLEDAKTRSELITYEHRHILLLIDFDGQVDSRLERYREIKATMTEGVANRIYLLGCLETPERLRASLGRRYEQIGEQLAAEGIESDLWQHHHLQHNRDELARLLTGTQSFLCA
jgi:hypothetical protein